MKTTVLCLLVLVAVAYVAARPKDEYTSKFDNIDVDQILHSDRLLTNYFKCLMDEGRCTSEGAELKKTLPDALETECSKCSEKHKEVVKKVIKFLVKEKPEMWDKLANKYDPDRKYRTKFENQAKELGVSV